MKKILIVEDDTNINNMICEVLKKQGYECIQAFSGTEGLLYVKQEELLLVLLDLMLPGMSGEGLLTEIKARGNTPVIVISAKDSLDSKVELLTNGAEDYITKPFELEELVARVGVQVLLMFLVLTVVMYVTGKVCYGSRFVFGPFGEFLKMFFGQYVLHYTFAAVILFFGVVSHSSALSITIGILISCKFLSIVYALVERFWTDVTKYALEVNVIRFFTITEKKEMATVMVSALVLFGVMTTAAAVVMQKKDVR